jgi:hypothetical protein
MFSTPLSNNMRKIHSVLAGCQCERIFLQGAHVQVCMLYAEGEEARWLARLRCDPQLTEHLWDIPEVPEID